MALTKKTEDERRQLALDWWRSGLTQPAFAARHGISSRTLRNYVRKYFRPATEADVQAVIAHAMHELELLRSRVRLGSDVSRTEHVGSNTKQLDAQMHQLALSAGNAPADDGGVLPMVAQNHRRLTPWSKEVSFLPR